MRQLLDGLGAVGRALVAELAAMGAQASAQGALAVGEMRRRVGVADPEMLQRGLGGQLGEVAGLDDGVFELSAQGFGEGVHGGVAP